MALRQLSSNGIIHADIKEENILISKDGVLKVIDFGLAIIDGGMVAPGGGTEGFVSPEVEQGVNTFKRDVFAVGMTLDGLLYADGSRDWHTHDLLSFMQGCTEDDMYGRYSVDELEMVSHRIERQTAGKEYPLICIFTASAHPGTHRGQRVCESLDAAGVPRFPLKGVHSFTSLSTVDTGAQEPRRLTSPGDL